jgi:hypothetical protein
VKNDKNILDNYLKEKVENTHFDLQESHWQHALAALDAQDDEDKKAVAWWKTLAVIALVIVSGIAYTLFSHPNKKPKPMAVVPTDVIVKQKEVVTVNDNKNKSNNDIINEVSAISNNKNIAAPTSTSKTIAAKHTITNTNFVSNNTNETIDAAPMATTANTESETVQMEKIELETTPILTRRNNRILAPKNIIAAIKKIGKRKTKSLTKIITTENKQENIGHKNDVVQTWNDKEIIVNKKQKSVATIKVQSSKNKIEKIDNIKTNTGKQTATIKNSIAAEQTTIEEPITKRNPKYLGDLNNYNQIKNTETWTNPRGKTTVMLVPKQQEAKTETISVSEVETPAKPKWQATKSTTSPTFNTQASMAAGPKTNTGASQWKPNAYVGIGFWMPLTNRWDMHLQLGATCFGGLQYHYQAINYNYSFGVDSNLFSIQHKTLYQLNIPLSISYKLNLKQSVLAGVGANFGLDVLSNVKGFTTATSSSQWGYNAGYTNVAPYFLVGYQYNIMPHIYLQALYQQGLADVTNNAIMRNTNIDKNSKATIGITFKLK